MDHENHVGMDHGAMDHNSMDHDAIDQGAMDHSSHNMASASSHSGGHGVSFQIDIVVNDLYETVWNKLSSANNNFHFLTFS